MRVDVYQDTAGGWRWRLRAKNGRIVAESGEAYSSKRALRLACSRMCEWSFGGPEGYSNNSEAFRVACDQLEVAGGR